MEMVPLSWVVGWLEGRRLWDAAATVEGAARVGGVTQDLAIAPPSDPGPHLACTQGVECDDMIVTGG